MNRTRPWLLASATILASLVLPGCSLVSGSGSSGPTSQPPASNAPATTAPASSPSDSSATTPPAGTASTEAGSTPSATDQTSGAPTPADPNASSGGGQLGQVFAMLNGKIEDSPATAEIYPVQRAGTVSYLNFVVKNKATQDDKAHIADAFSDGDPSAGDSSGYAADGPTLVDSKNSKLYLVATDGNKHCLCSNSLLSVDVSDEAPALVSATFAAPPTTLSSIDVRIPNFGTVRNVPIS